MYNRNFCRHAVLLGSISLSLFSCQKQAIDRSADKSLSMSSGNAKSVMAEMNGTSFYALTASNEIVNYLSGNPLKGFMEPDTANLVNKTANAIPKKANTQTALTADFFFTFLSFK